MIATVPVSTDRSADRITGNEISGITISLPVHIDDPLQRVELTSLSTKLAKEGNELLGPELQGRMMEYLPPPLAPAMFRRQSNRADHNRLMNVAVSNVPGPRERGHVGGAPVSEIYSVGVLSAGSAVNMTVWSYVDQLDISVLSDDQTFKDPHEATDAMIHAFGEIRRACDLGEPTTVGTRDGARDRGALAQHRETAFARQLVERRSASPRGHVRSTASMSGSSPNSAGDVDRLEHSVTILEGSGRFGGKTGVRPNGNPKLIGRISTRARFRPSRLAIQSPRARNNWVSWAPIDTIGTIGTPALDGCPDVAGAALEVDDVLRERRPVGVVVTAGEHQHDRAVPQRLRGVLAARLDDASTAQPITDIGDEDAVMGQRVQRPVEAELLVEGRGEDQHIGSEHAARVVRHHQRATGGRHRVEVAHFGAEVPLDDRAHHVRDLPGESGIPLGDLWFIRSVAHVIPVPPASAPRTEYGTFEKRECHIRR